MKSLPPQLLGRTGNFGHLPTLPHILLKMIGVCNQDSVSLQEVSRVLGKDVALSARLMGTVDFVRGGGQDRVATIDQAISLAGANAVKNIVTCAALKQTLDQPAERPSLAWLKKFWRHSLMCATLAKLIAEKASYHSPNEAYLSGLLHDVGKLMLYRPSLKNRDTADSHLYGDEPDFAMAEKILGATHCEIGAEMIHRWNLRSFMADAVLYHHEPVRRVVNALPLVKLVFVANALCSEGSDDTETRHEIAEQLIGLTLDEAEGLMSQARKEVERAAEFFEIEFEPSGEDDANVPETDGQKQTELFRTVRDISLVQGMLQNGLEVHDVESIIRVIKQGFQVLFDARDLLLFLYNHERGALVGKSGLEAKQDALIQDVVIPVQKEKSLVAECLLRGRPLDSYGRLDQVVLSILDHEILRLLGKDGMLCLPLTARSAFVGAVVLGTDQTDVDRLLEEISLLRMFANRAALLVYAEKVRQIHEKSAESDSVAEPSDLARKVVHEVSNPLGIIKNYLRILGPKLADEGKGQEEIRIINEEIDRVSSIVRKLSDFSKPNVQKKESIDINGLISDLIKITHEPLLLQSNIKAHFDKDSSLPPIVSDKNGLKQVLINLIKNAVEAMPEGGNLFIQTRSVSDGFDDEGHSGGKPAYVEIGVRDEGRGIPKTVKPRLFEPFVSSKGAGHAGLGLSIAHTIVRDLDGKITCESEGEKGTIFKVVLPTGSRTTE